MLCAQSGEIHVGIEGQRCSDTPTSSELDPTYEERLSTGFPVDFSNAEVNAYMHGELLTFIMTGIGMLMKEVPQRFLVPPKASGPTSADPADPASPATNEDAEGSAEAGEEKADGGNEQQAAASDNAFEANEAQLDVEVALSSAASSTGGQDDETQVNEEHPPFDALLWLGHWLKQNNPNVPSRAAADADDNAIAFEGGSGNAGEEDGEAGSPRDDGHSQPLEPEAGKQASPLDGDAQNGIVLATEDDIGSDESDFESDFFPTANQKPRRESI